MKAFFIIVIAFLFGCEHSHSKKTIANKSAKNSNQKKILNNEQAGYYIRQKNDSIQFDVMMHDILLYADKHKNAKSYYKKFENWEYKATTNAILTFGHLFCNTKKHLIVRRTIAESIVNVDVFLFEKSKFKLVCHQVVDGMTYLNDTIKDVNGDHQRDFLIHWYPSSGCCRRDIFNVYLYQKDKGNFSIGYEFMNPTFSPSEKIIRGIGYGQPGDVQLYKYKWNGLKVDTVEFIFPDTLSKKFHVFQHWHDFDDSKSGKYLALVPKEYHKIKSYDWFKGIY